MPIVTVRELIDAGMHYGHHVSRWNPKMKGYIFGKRNAIHIIDLRETVRGLITACKYVTQIVSEGKLVLLVGTKRQACDSIREHALRCGMPFVADRWLGGTLTNFRTIRSRMDRLMELESIIDGPAVEQYSKQEASRMRRELQKMRRNLDGIRTMDRLPGALVIVDPKREKNAVAEAQRLGIATVCLADTDCDPDNADILIPGNDCAMRSVSLVLSRVADAVQAGQEKRREMARLEAQRSAAAAASAAPSAEARPRTRHPAPPPPPQPAAPAVETPAPQPVPPAQ